MKVICIHKGKQKNPSEKLNYGSYIGFIIKQINEEEKQKSFENFQIILQSQGMMRINFCKNEVKFV